jgi:hypothetical protein
VSIVVNKAEDTDTNAIKIPPILHQPHILKVTPQRIEMMNKLNSTGAKVNIVDLKDENGIATGTRVELIIPV